MPDLPLADLIEYDGAVPYQDLKQVDMSRLKRQHDLRWVLHTSVGDCVLKKIGQLDMDHVTLGLANDNPEFLSLVQKAKELKNFEQEGYPMGPTQLEELVNIMRKLAEFQPYHNMVCFVRVPPPRIGEPRNREEPMFKDIEDYDAFLSSLRQDEVDHLYPILAELTSPKPPGDVIGIVLTLCKEFNIPFASDLTAENITAEQAATFGLALRLEGEAVQKAMKEIPKNAQS